VACGFRAPGAKGRFSGPQIPAATLPAIVRRQVLQRSKTACSPAPHEDDGPMAMCYQSPDFREGAANDRTQIMTTTREKPWAL